jgi:hypothetical protein
MQIIDLYIRDGNKYTSEGYFPTTTRLVDTSTDFTTGNFKVGQLIKNLNSGAIGSITAIAPSGNVNTLDVDGGVFNGTNQPYQIYDDYTKLELFKDESVSITDTIQNVKDPAKIFAPFSQQFSVPASKHNNKFFKHYYDSEIQNSFDARFQGDGLIQLNGVNYKIGKLRLTSVDLKNNVAYSYKLVFTGETVEFKQILAENELSSLLYPEALNFQYTSDFVKSKLRGTAEGDDVIFPLITHSKNMRYNYNSNPGYRDAITGTHLNYADLKPALKTKVIIDAIQTTYPQIVFSQQFFNSTVFKKMYMWLHREEGYLSNADEGGAAQQISNRFYLPENASSAATNYNFVSGTELRPARCFHTSNTFLARRYGYIFTLNVSFAGTRDYEVKILRASDNSELFSATDSTAQTFTYEFTRDNYGENDIDVFININTDNTLGISQTLTVQRGYRIFSGPFQLEQTGNYQKLATTDANTIVIANQMPKMKIFDFLKNIFTMFNLTAYKEDGIITVLPLDDYYNAGKVYDITEYVDTSKSKISKLLQFKNMIFNFKSKKSYLVQYAEELQGNIFAHESYGNDEWDGGNYKVEVDFEKMMYERLTDEGSGQLTTIVQGAMLDKKFEPTIGSPLLFYCFSTATNDALLFQNDDNSLSNINPYLRPSNSISNIATGFITQTLNFGIEIDEYTLGTGSAAQQNLSNDLFTKYYRNYVANLFARNSRKTNVSAYLPLNIILKYRLNDIFIIGTTEYRINSIKTNLLTNKSDLELYNLKVNTSQSLRGQSQTLQRVENLETTSKTSSSVTLGWSSLQSNPNFQRYDIYQDDEFKGTVQTTTSATFTSLDSDTTYKFSIRAIYDVDSVEAGAFDTDLFETTL